MTSPMIPRAACRIPTGPAAASAISPPTPLAAPTARKCCCAWNRNCPTWWQHIALGDLRQVKGWLQSHIHRHGSLYQPAKLFEMACGPFDARHYTDYLTKKYTELYHL